jgi:hypothetical protein
MSGVSNPFLALPTNRAAKPGVHRSGYGPVQARTGECSAGLKRSHVLGEAGYELSDASGSQPGSVCARTQTRLDDCGNRWAGHLATGNGHPVDDLVGWPWLADYEAVRGELPTDCVDINAIHLRRRRDLIIIQWRRAATKYLQHLIPASP